MGLILLLPGEAGRLVHAFALAQIGRTGVCSCPGGRDNTLLLMTAVFVAPLLCAFSARGKASLLRGTPC